MMSYLYMTPMKGSFIPEDLPFSYLFYDRHTESSGNLTSWLDKTSNGYDATAFGTIPVTLDPAINNKPSYTFAGGNKYLDYATGVNLFDINTPWTFVAVLEKGAGVSFNLVNPIRGTSGVGAHFGITDSANYRWWYVGSNGGGAQRANTTTLDGAGWVLLIATYNGAGTPAGNWTMYRNNVSETITTGSGVAHDNVVNRIGAQGNTILGSFFFGKMAMIAGGPFLMTTEERNALVNWALSYYGVA